MEATKRTAKIMATVIALVLALSVSFAFATEPGNYAGYVKKLNDLQSSPVTKVGTTSAAFTINDYSGDGSCDFWVENSSGTNLTEKKERGGKTKSKVLLNYNGSASTYKGKRLHLCVSTTLGTFNNQYVKGQWSPDNLISL